MPELPETRIKRVDQLRALAGRTVYFVAHATNGWNHWEPYSNTRVIPWIVGPIVQPRTFATATEAERGPRYTDQSDSSVYYCVHAEDVLIEAQKVRMFRMSDYNCGKRKKGGGPYLHQAVFDNERDAELWRVMVALSFDACSKDEEKTHINPNAIVVERFHVVEAANKWLHGEGKNSKLIF